MAMLGIQLVSLLTNIQFRKSIYALILVITFVDPIRYAIAGSASAPLTITVTVVRSCSLSTGPMLFGTNIPTSVAADGAPNAIVTFTCAKEFNPAVIIRRENSTTEPVSAQRIFAVGNNLADGISTNFSPRRGVNDSEGTGRPRVMPAIPTDSRVTISPRETPSGKIALPEHFTDNMMVTVNF